MDPRVFRIAPELRRCAIITMVGFVFLTAVWFWVGYVVMEHSAIRAFAGAMIYLLISLSMIIPLRWAMRVSERGIERRWFKAWDFWSWEEFANGRLKKRAAITFVDPSRPWWRRSLRLDYLSTSDRKTIIQAINHHYQLPSAPAVPESLRGRYGFRRVADFDSNGVRLTSRGVTSQFPWDAVEHVRIRRFDPKRRDFMSLELRIAGQEVKFPLVEMKYGLSGIWGSGVSTVIANQFLLDHVPADRMAIDIVGERPVRLSEIEKQLNLARKNEKDIPKVYWFLGILIGTMNVLLALTETTRRVLMVAGVAEIVLFAPLLWLLPRELRNHTKQWETWLEEYRREHLSNV